MTGGAPRLKILHLDTGPELRGGQQQLLLLARGLRLRGHHQLIVCPEGSALEKLARKEEFRAFALPPHDPAHAHGIMQLRQLLHSETYQVIHAHDGKGQTLSWLASVGIEVCRVASRRVTFLPARRLDSRLKYGRMCDRVIAVSNFVRQLLMDSGVPESRIEVIPDGVEIPEAPPDGAPRETLRAHLRIAPQEFAAGYVGAWSKEKGVDTVLAAANLLLESAPQVRILLAPVRRPAFLPGYPSNVREAPFPQDLSEFLAALDLYIMPSLAEGLGSSALLAMAHGLPVIASRVGGLPEIVEDGKTGWLVPPGSPNALAESIRSAAALGSDSLRHMGAAGREQARRFSSDIMAERTEALYLRLLSVRPGRQKTPDL